MIRSASIRRERRACRDGPGVHRRRLALAGTSPYYCVTVSDEESLDLREVSSAVTCGWGDDPGAGVDRRHRVGDVADPKDGLYVVPLKDAVRRAEGLAEGDTVRVRLRPGVSRRR